MIEALLQTKLYIPPLRPSLVPRPRLTEKLNGKPDNGNRFSGKLTLISAPAGFGKTTLINEWVQRCRLPVSWVSLDESDNDPAHFLAYLIAALQKIEPDIGKSAITSPLPLQTPATETVLTAVINDITAHEDSFILVLDDYHLITAQPVHDALTFLLDHLPPQMRLVIATRADPPLPLALLRGRGQLTELRQADLQFTPEEAAAFLNQVMGLQLSADDVVALSARTEGWITGLHMAAVALQGREDASAFIRAFTGSDRYIADYLVEEVLNRQPAHIQDFLLKTAVLDRLSARLCHTVLENEALASGSDGDASHRAPISNQQILEQLERSNLFIVPLDERREWYRYHQLFTDLLQRRLLQLHPALVPELYRRASDWCEQNGLAAMAIDYALSANDFERAAQLMEQTAEAVFKRSEIATFLNWVQALPEELVQARPTLCLHHAAVLLQYGRSFDVVEARLQHVSKTGLLPGQVAALQAHFAIYRSQIPLAIELSHQALAQLPPDEPFLRQITVWNLGFSYQASGELEASAAAFAEVAKTSLSAGNMPVAVLAYCEQARLKRRQGDLHQVQALYQQALELAVDEEKRRSPIAGIPLIGLGDLAREWNKLELAVERLHKGIQLARQWSSMDPQIGYTSLVRLKLAQGDEAGASEALQQARQLALKSDATNVDDLIVDIYQAWLWIVQGNVAAARRWAEARGLNQFDPAQLTGLDSSLVSQIRKYEYLMMARIWLAQNRPDAALALLRPLLSWMEQRKETELQIRIQILIALACQAQSDTPQALSALARALSLAKPGGYLRIFVDEGPAMAALLQKAAAQAIAPDYVKKLIAACDEPGKEPKTISPPLQDPLSQRELEVLRLLATNLSAPEIAEELYIAVSTVRSHVKHIYSKLGVSRRGEAVDQARHLELI